MNKKITTLILALFMGSAMFAQNVLKLGDFEDGTTNGFTDDGAGTTVTNAANPAPDAVNKSAKVLQVDYPVGYPAWAGATSDPATTFVLTSTKGAGYRYLHFKIYIPFMSKILVVVENQTKGEEQMISEAFNNSKSQWEDMVIDLLDPALVPSWGGGIVNGDTYNQLSIRADQWTMFTATGFTCYLDNIYLSDSSNPISALNTGNMQKDDAYVSRTNGKVTLHLNEATSATGKIEVLNIQGQVVKNVFKGKINEGQSTFDFPVENSGLYLLRITTDKGVQCIKF